MNTKNVKTENGKLPIFGVYHSALRNLLEDVRVWNSEWDKYDGTGKKPKSVDAYMEELNEKYAVCFKITEREN